MTAPATLPSLDEAFSTALAAWRIGRQPSLQIISQLIDAGYDVDAIARRQGQARTTGADTVTTQNEVMKPAPFTLEVQVIDGEARVLDTALAEQLGMARLTNIRSDLIEANREELEGFGILQAKAANSTGRGRPATAFYLNRQQALLICILSKTPRAREVRAEVIRRFDAYETPAAQPPPVPGMDQVMAAILALTQVVQGALVKPAAIEPPHAARGVIPERPSRRAEMGAYGAKRLAEVEAAQS